MTDETEDSRYEHQFEDLNGSPDADSEVDLGTDDDSDFDSDASANEEQATRDAPGAEDEERAGEAEASGDDDSQEPAKQADPRDQELAQMRREIAQMRAEKQTEQHEAQSKADAAKLDQDIAESRRKMSEAHEEGDTDAAVEAQQALVDLQVRKQIGSQAQQTQPNQNAAPDVPEAGRRWVARNQWFYHGSNPQAANTALAIEQQLRGEGYDPNDDAMYAEIDNRLKRQHPEMAPAKAKPKKRGNGAPTNGMGAQAAPARSGKVTITAEDKRWMAQTGLDPDNPTHAKAWAREKRAAEQRA